MPFLLFVSACVLYTLHIDPINLKSILKSMNYRVIPIYDVDLRTGSKISWIMTASAVGKITLSHLNMAGPSKPHLLNRTYTLSV